MTAAGGHDAVEEIGLGGGCHWCTEGVFQALRGVIRVDQGFLQSQAPWDAWSEGVLVRFDPAAISLATLVEVHLRTHYASGTYSPNGRYRSAVYTVTALQGVIAAKTIAAASDEPDRGDRTLILPLAGFRPSDERYRNYYRTDPNRPFCRRYIDPKLDLVRREFADVALPAPD